MWQSLPSNLRTVLGTALLLGIGVAAASFGLSFFALRAAASDPALGWGANHAWLFPIGIDMALIFFEVLLIGASMIRVQGPRGPEPYPRAIPFALVLIAAAGSLYFNAERVPEAVRPIALAVPVASILVTLGLAYLLKALSTASGTGVIHLAPPPAQPGRIVAATDVLQAQATRVGGGELPSSDWSEIGHSDQRGSEVDGGERGAVTAAIRTELAQLDPTTPTTVGDQQVAGLVWANHGLRTTPGYVGKVRREARNGSRP